MEASLRNFINRARRGESVYITELRAAFSVLAPAERRTIECVVALIDGSQRQFELRLPRTEVPEEALFVREYLYASLYNIVSALGAREIRLYGDLSDAPTATLLASLDAAFSIRLPKLERRGYGAAINVTDRIVASMQGGSRGGEGDSFRFVVLDLASFEPAPAPAAPEPGDSSVFLRAAQGLKGRLLCGMDVGGTDVKAVVVRDGLIIGYKEYDWFPAAFGRMKDIVDPIVHLVALMRAIAALNAAKNSGRSVPPELAAAVEAALHKDALPALVERAATMAELQLPIFYERFDGIGLSFPDVVIGNKIVGGETYKTRGVRNNPAVDYDREFGLLTGLDALLSVHAKEAGAVRIINDGPMAAYTAATEMAAAQGGESESSGIFAHTLGTELGTGWVRGDGSIPDIPLEVYNFIIDMGNWPARIYAPDDVRSTNNFNTGLPGTLQKYTSQSGVFRLAERCFSQSRPDLLKEAVGKGFLHEGSGDGESGLFVPTAPSDMRKPFLEYCLELPDRDGDPALRELFRKIGEYLAITVMECDHILRPGTSTRFLFGRLVKNSTCFDLIYEGARRLLPEADFRVADSSLAETPLMRQLAGDGRYTVAQFAQAIGAIYFCNARESAQALSQRH